MLLSEDNGVISGRIGDKGAKTVLIIFEHTFNIGRCTKGITITGLVLIIGQPEIIFFSADLA
jgi:hypothetical protein